MNFPEESDTFDDFQPDDFYPDEEVVYDYPEDDPDWEPPCACWCEICGCHGYCDEEEEEEEDFDE